MTLSLQADLEAAETQNQEACKFIYWSLGFTQVEESCDFFIGL